MKVVGAEDAAVAQAADLTGGGELDQTGREGTRTVDIDGYGDTLLTTDDVAVGGGDIPDAPGDALVMRVKALGDAPEFG